MKIQYISDLHIELLHDKKIESLCSKVIPVAPILVLSGDIGNPYKSSYKIFLENMNLKFEKIFIICGNHEYYGNKINDTKLFVRELCSQISNVVFLDNDIYEYQGYVFLGSTLWSCINDATNTINDTLCINGMTVEKYNDLHNESLQFIKEQLIRHNNVIIITHHLPSYMLIDSKYSDCGYLQWFASHLDDLMLREQDKIVCWIYGHTHTSRICTIHDVPMFCNPIGYKGENKDVYYKKLINIVSP
jgi:predicted phosphodiesterase